MKENPDRDAEGIFVEAFLGEGLGTAATALVKRGTNRVGDFFVAGETHGRVLALRSTTDKSRMKEAGPSTRVSLDDFEGVPAAGSIRIRLVGFEGVPAAGDMIFVAPDEQTARELAESRRHIARESSSSVYQAGLLSSVSKTFGSTKISREMRFVVKANVQWSAEALTRAFRERSR